MDIARIIVNPADERRFLLSTGGASFSRVGDVAELVESEQNEYFFCIDLIGAGRGIVERAKKPLLSFIYGGDQQTSVQVRRFSHGQSFD